ncbi:MAG: SUMF1/EgtB/PvdO family nonheme iron enzyme [Planctomycetes bacterium]|nr:SUMF1/EgtB/PvdO family nonheme iron enzyme [Planctomycetota bacterium]
MSTNPSPVGFEPSRESLELFADHLARDGAGTAESYETFCLLYAERADELQQLRDEWEYLKPLKQALRTKAEFLQLLIHLYQPPVDADPGDAPAHDAGDDLLEVLLARGNTTGKYRFRGRIETGGMGVVWRVWDRETRRNLAMKMMKQPTTRLRRQDSDPGQYLQVRRFLDEAQITGQLDHPGVVPVHEIGVDASGRVFFTMKIVRGRDLKHIIEDAFHGRDGWTLRKIIQIMVRVCETMAYAHQKNVIHRDLKPGNIMVGRFGEVFVMDWGVARVLSSPDLHDLRIRENAQIEHSTIQSSRRDIRESDPDSPLLTMDGSVLGTPAYMSPEQAMGLLESVGPRSDIYSIGAILYHLLTGHMPYVPHGARMGHRTLLGLVIQGPPLPIRAESNDAPPPLVAICEKAMARDPEHRFDSFEELAADLTAWLESRPIIAKPPSARETVVLFIRRNRALFGTSAAAASLLLSSALVFVWNLDREVRAKSLAMRETQSYRDGLVARRLLRILENDLRPLMPREIASTAAWLEASAAVLARLEMHRLEYKQSGAASPFGAELKEVVATLEALEAGRPRAGELYQLALTARERSVDRYRKEWDAACADVAASELYHHLALPPQTGLVPIRKDSISRLWEFWVVDSGARPEWSDATQHYKLRDDSGIVLVLLPGGPFDRGQVGSADATRDGENGGAPAFEDEGIAHCNLAPFFISKFETTQGQWIRLFTTNPSLKHAHDANPDLKFYLTNPVESIDWHCAGRYARAFGCALPTESQWEYAARSGSANVYYFGAAADDCYKYENIADRELGLLDASFAAQTEDAPSDGYPFHAPVGSFRSNNFGLFDMLGNVAEWCADDYVAKLPDSIQSPDGLVTSVDSKKKSARGGSWHSIPLYARCAQRRFWAPDYKNFNMGFRIARPIDLE